MLLLQYMYIFGSTDLPESVSGNGYPIIIKLCYVMVD